MQSRPSIGITVGGRRDEGKEDDAEESDAVVSEGKEEELQIVPELVGVHAAFVVPSDDRSKFVDQAPGRTKLRSGLEISFTRPDDNVLHTLPTWQK